MEVQESEQDVNRWFGQAYIDRNLLFLLQMIFDRPGGFCHRCILYQYCLINKVINIEHKAFIYMIHYWLKA